MRIGSQSSSIKVIAVSCKAQLCVSVFAGVCVSQCAVCVRVNERACVRVCMCNSTGTGYAKMYRESEKSGWKSTKLRAANSKIFVWWGALSTEGKCPAGSSSWVLTMSLGLPAKPLSN